MAIVRRFSPHHVHGVCRRVNSGRPSNIVATRWTAEARSFRAAAMQAAHHDCPACARMNASTSACCGVSGGGSVANCPPLSTPRTRTRRRIAHEATIRSTRSSSAFSASSVRSSWSFWSALHPFGQQDSDGAVQPQPVGRRVVDVAGHAVAAPPRVRGESANYSDRRRL